MDPIKQAFLNIRIDSLRNDSLGICYNFEHRYCEITGTGILSGVSKAIHKLLKDCWEKPVSEDFNFPILHETLSPEHAFLNGSLWDLKTQYGRDRLEALYVIIENSRLLSLSEFNDLIYTGE